MLVKNVIQEDFSNYKTCSMFIGFPSCTWKCERECGLKGICQNAELAKARTIDIPMSELLLSYQSNPLSRAIVCGGLEPFDSWDSLQYLVETFRVVLDDMIVIYTGYTKEELVDKIEWLKNYKNIIIKFGRFRPNEESHYDSILGVKLASANQYAERIS
jgi:hypothetical protein